MTGNIAWLQRWYLSQCDQDWEHQFGVQIGTLDNPGWRLLIDLQGTELADLPFVAQKIERTETDWIRLRITSFKQPAAPRILKKHSVLSGNGQRRTRPDAEQNVRSWHVPDEPVPAGEVRFRA